MLHQRLTRKCPKRRKACETGSAECKHRADDWQPFASPMQRKFVHAGQPIAQNTDAHKQNRFHQAMTDHVDTGAGKSGGR